MAKLGSTTVYGNLKVMGIAELFGSVLKDGDEVATEDWVLGKNYITSASLPNLSNYPDHINLASGKEYRINGAKLSKTDIGLGNVANALQAKAPGSNKGETQNKTLTYSGGNASTFKVLEVKTDGTIEERIMTMPGVPTVGSDANKLVVTGSGGILSTPNAPSEDSVVILKGSTGNYSIVDYATLKSYLAVPDVHSWLNQQTLQQYLLIRVVQV